MLSVRPMTREDLERAGAWATAEGWNPGRGDLDAFWAADPGGFWVGETDGEVVATISLVRWSTAFGFAGFYIVRPDLRGRGHGLALWQAVVDASPLATIGLDGVPDQEPNYERSGFTLAYRTARYGGVIAGGDDAGLIDATALPRDALAAFDAAHVPAARPAFLERWLHGPRRSALAVTGEDGALRGYGALRAAADGGHRIGPLFAADAGVAERLLGALGARAGGPVAIDVPLANAGAVRLVEGLGLTPSFETARMYRGPHPDLPVARVHGVSSLELG